MSEIDSVSQTPEETPIGGAPPPPAVPSYQSAAPSFRAAEGGGAPRKSRKGPFFLGLFSGCLIVFVALFMLAIFIAAVRNDDGELAIGSDKIAVVPIEGEIFESRETIEALHRYANNTSVKAIVVRINSPGGAIAPSQEIYSEIRRTRERSGKPVVASMDSVAASGGYYIAAGCDRIIANPGTITGSIGVIMEWLEMKELMQWAKMKPETITSGTLKGAGSPYRELSEPERAYFQRIVAQLHIQFVKAIAEGRAGKLTEAEVTRLADGRVFTGEEALSLKLVDELGSMHDAVRAAAKLAGIKGEPTMIYPKKRDASLLDVLSGGADAQSLLERITTRRVPRFLYRW
jgi:protease-4